MPEPVDMQKHYNDALAESEETYEHKRWFSTPQRQAAYEMTLDRIMRFAAPHVSNGSRMLEVGAGPGTWTKALLKKAPLMHVDIVDISDEMLNQARNGLVQYNAINYQRADFELFEPEQAYDFFFSSRAVEYMPNIDTVAATIGRSLKVGGWGCVITKYPHYDRAKMAGTEVPDVHKLQISPSRFVAALEAARCTVVKKVAVTMVVPKMESGTADMIAYSMLGWLPLQVVQQFTESYMLVFKKQ